MNNMIEVEGTAKNVNEAIENAVSKALDQLGLPREEVTYELLDRGKTGFLGLGGVWVKLRVFYEIGMTRKTEEFLSGLFELMNVKADVRASEGEDGRVDVTLSGPDMGLLIGRRGETLDALQYITSLAANKGNDKFVRVTIDSENYREKREESLENLANRIADKVLKNQRSMTLEPMSPHERRIIHACLQNKEGITTFSTGQDPNRRVVIAPENGDQKPHRQYRGHRGGRKNHSQQKNGSRTATKTENASETQK
ncbi:MAG: protein jag [Clostridiales bacterium]|nr:protein jag [Clostridiales bacterium]